MKFLLHAVLAIALYNGIQMIWGILFDIYTKYPVQDNKTANNIFYFSLAFSAYLYLKTL